MPALRTLLAFVGGLAVPAALWFGTFALQLGMPSTPSRWNAAVFAEKDTIARRVEGPRIVIAGGSGALYGIRARDLSAELGVPVINAGLHAGLGLEYSLHQLAKLVRPGDTIVFALEYQMYMDLPDGPVLIDYLASRDPAYFARLGIARQAEDALRMSFGRLANPFLVRRHPAPAPDPASLWNDAYLDAYGDTLGNAAVLKTEALRRSLDAIHPLRVWVDAPAVERLRAFAAWARERGITLLATHPNTIDFPAYYGRPDIERKLAQVDAAHVSLAIPFVDGWRDTLLDRGLFFDTVYHLDSVGSTLRTRALARRLAPYLRRRTFGPAYVAAPSDHPLEVLDRNFRMFEPLAGFGPVAVQGDVGPVVAAAGGRLLFMAPADTARPAHFTVRVRSSVAGSLDVVKDGRPLAAWRLDGGAAFQSFEADVALQAGENRFELVHSGAAPLTLAALRIE